MKKTYFVLTIIVVLLAGCAQASQSGNPAWVDQLIRNFLADPVGNPPLSIWSYQYNGQSVYFVPAHCCDIASVVYDSQGAVLCSPDGGITGKGDGKCPDFLITRTNEQLIWQDNRSR